MLSLHIIHVETGMKNIILPVCMPPAGPAGPAWFWSTASGVNSDPTAHLAASSGSTSSQPSVSGNTSSFIACSTKTHGYVLLWLHCECITQWNSPYCCCPWKWPPVHPPRPGQLWLLGPGRSCRPSVGAAPPGWWPELSPPSQPPGAPAALLTASPWTHTHTLTTSWEMFCATISTNMNNTNNNE